MTDVTVTAARSLDAGVIGDILSATNDQMPWLPRVHSAAEEIKYAGDMIDAGWIRVAHVEEKVVGFIARDDTQIHALYVLPEAQHQGVGTALLEDAKQTCDILRLWSYQENLMATRFYASRGFAELERTDGSSNDARLPDIHFEWTRSAG